MYFNLITCFLIFQIPVFKGARSALIPGPPSEKPPFHGQDGLGDTSTFEPDMSILQTKHAVTAINDLISENANDITLIAVGPLTNVALTFKMYPECISKISEIFLMGGNYTGVGNATKSAEFNFHADPESVHIVLEATKCPTVIVPWETCYKDSLYIPMEWRVDVLGAIDNEITRLMNPADANIYPPRGYKHWLPCDALLVAVFLEPKMILKSNNYHATIELAGIHTRGQVVIDHLRREDDNTTFIEKVDQDLFQKMALWTAGHPVEL